MLDLFYAKALEVDYLKVEMQLSDSLNLWNTYKISINRFRILHVKKVSEYFMDDTT